MSFKENKYSEDYQRAVNTIYEYTASTKWHQVEKTKWTSAEVAELMRQHAKKEVSQDVHQALAEAERKIEDKIDLLQGNRLQNASDMSEVDGLNIALNYIQEIKTNYTL